MALLVNGEKHPFRLGMTVEQLLAEMKFSFPLKTVFVNGRRIPKADQGATVLQDEDKVDVVHIMSGG